MRIEPPVSVPIARSHTPAATSAADPPEEPPEVRDGSRGLRVSPISRVGEAGRELQALRGGEHLRARRAQPADQRRVLGGGRGVAGRAAAPGRQPATAMMSLTATGRPASGPSAARRRGAPATDATAFSGRPSRSSRS